MDAFAYNACIMHTWAITYVMLYIYTYTWTYGHGLVEVVASAERDHMEFLYIKAGWFSGLSGWPHRPEFP